ncbi:hypothetical protein HGP17_14385 [Rhizobium sp. P38BS-XIX]|uniref:Imm42 family immunity protein n=1 Tax=Rhizobium sp. P38BS-XIX TaxID=2726740 RepID=UPI001456F6B7|nr:Imm42 family immunity protein [Rhizobium sp. P38BS-XIX]NLR98004.1 hypothetical protein [Rhizobium sp. P38BS-XIX]
MIVGDYRVFAVESTVADVIESPSQLALGSFVIHVGGRSFGLSQPDATMLGCSFYEVQNRLQRRGTHLLPLLNEVVATEDGAFVYEECLEHPRRYNGKFITD